MPTNPFAPYINQKKGSDISKKEPEKGFIDKAKDFAGGIIDKAKDTAIDVAQDIPLIGGAATRLERIDKMADERERIKQNTGLVPNIIDGVDVNQPPPGVVENLEPQNLQTVNEAQFDENGKFTGYERRRVANMSEEDKQALAEAEAQQTAADQQALLDGKLNEQLIGGRDLLDDLGMTDTETYMSRYDILRDQIDNRGRQTSLRLEEIDLIEEQTLAQLEQMKRQYAGAIGNNRNQFAQSREGAFSAGNAQYMQEYERLMSEELGRSIDAQEMNIKKLNQQRHELKLMQKMGDTEAAAALSERIALTEDSIRQNQMNYMDSYGNFAKTMMDVDQQRVNNTKSFFDMVSTGMITSQEGVVGLAQSMGIDTGVALNTWGGVQEILANNEISQTDKLIALKAAEMDLHDQTYGFDSAQGKALKLVETLRSQGADEETIQAVKRSAGINEWSDPMVRLENEALQLENAIQKAKLNGDPVGYEQYANLYEKQAELAYARGETGAYVPTESVGMSFSIGADGKLQLDAETINSGYSHCGKFVNDAWGRPDGANLFGNTFASKKDNISIDMRQVQNNPTLVQPGMAVIMPAAGGLAEFGHVALVSSHVRADGSFDVWEAFTQSDGVTMGKVKKGEYNINNLDPEQSGFARPPQGTYELAGGTKSRVNTALSLLDISGRSLGSSDQNRLDNYNSIKGAIEMGNFELAQENLIRAAITDDAGQGMEDKFINKNNAVKSLEETKRLIQEFEAKGGDMGWFNGKATEVLNKVGVEGDPELQRIGQDLLWNLEMFARGQTGAQIADSEEARFERLLPVITDSSGLAISKIEGLTRNFNKDLEHTLQTFVGKNLYDAIFEDPAQQTTPSSTQEAEIDYTQFYESGGDVSTLIGEGSAEAQIDWSFLDE